MTKTPSQILKLELAPIAALDTAPPPGLAPGAHAASITPSEWTEDVPENTAIYHPNMAGHDLWGHHTPRKPHSISSPDDNEIVYELRKGEKYSGNWPDGGTTERCEMGMHDRPIIRGNTFVVTFKYMIEDTGDITSSWLTTGQLHSALSQSPPVQIQFNGNNRMAVSANHGSSSRPEWHLAWLDDDDVKREHWYSLRLEVLLDDDGIVILWRDGEKVCDYQGPVGYTDQIETYWKQGVYRNSPPGGETLRIHYKDFEFEEGLSLPLAPPTTETEPPETEWPENLNIDLALAYTEWWVNQHK